MKKSLLPTMSLSPSWKERKEAHVTGHEGTRPHELVWIALVPPVVGLLFFASVLDVVGRAEPPVPAEGVLLPEATNDKKTIWRWFYRHYHWTDLVLEVFCFYLPVILCQSDFLYPYGVLYLVGLATLSAASLMVTSRQATNKTKATDEVETIDWISPLTLYRSSLMVLTLTAILAVDFRVFPRRFVKTETRGYSLMDLGAASFVTSAGIVSSRVAKKSKPLSRMKWWKRFWPLVGLGTLRLVTHQSIDYPEHASEYGVHWNFMFTLAALTFVIGFNVVPPVASLGGLAATWTAMGAYQVLLNTAGLQAWIETAPRICARPDHSLGNFLVANREGLLGCFGYTVLFLTSEWIASAFLWNDTTAMSKSSMTKSLLLFRAGSVGSLLASIAMESLGIVTVSRRSTNAWFLLWVLSLNLVVLAGLQVTWEAITKRRRRANGVDSTLRLPSGLAAVNRHGFLIFVVANLLTGAVNLSIDTLEVTNASAICVLLLYIIANVSLALLLDKVLVSR
jgi:phosphatidylinositol glycan class W